MGEILWQRLGRADEAVEHFRWVTESDPGNESAVLALEQMLEEGAPVHPIAEILEPI